MAFVCFLLIIYWTDAFVARFVEAFFRGCGACAALLLFCGARRSFALLHCIFLSEFAFVVRKRGGTRLGSYSNIADWLVVK